MKNSILMILLAALLIGVTVSDAQAAMMSESWIVRSEVRPNSSLWGTGPGGSLNPHDTYVYAAGVFRASFDWNVQLDPGTLVANAEGYVTAEYEDTLAAPGVTNVRVSYAGLADESHVGANVAAKVTMKPSIGVNLGLGWLDTAIPVSVIDVDFSTGQDFTTGLGTAHPTDSQRHNLLSLGGDLLVFTYGMDVFMENWIEFTPQLISGKLNYEHVETQTKRSANVGFSTDGTRDFDLNLDLPGHWEVTLDYFRLEQSDFRSGVDFGLKFAAGVPIIGAELALEPEINVHDSGTFGPLFEFHNLGGDSTLGRFSIYVVPLPPTLWLVVPGLVVLVARGPRSRSRSG